MSQPSKVTTFRSPPTDVVPDWVETEEEALCSVELGETAKRESYVKSVKAYGRTAGAAADMALETWVRLKASAILGGEGS